METRLLIEDTPWLPYLVTEYIKTIKPRRVFEWGSGGSTGFFANLKCVDQLVSIEHDAEWYQKVKVTVNDEWVTYRHIPFEQGEICGDKSDTACYKSGSTELGPVNFKSYASVIDEYGLFDLILIDGMARPSCLAHAYSHVAPGGCIVLDNNGDRPYYLEKTGHLFGNYETGWESIRFMGYGPILDYQWETTIFINRQRQTDDTGR